MVRKNVGQSILELGYHCPFEYGDEQHLSMIVMNGLLVELLTLNYLQMSVKNAGLAYTISSQLDLFSGFLRMYAGIDQKIGTRLVK